MNTSGPIYTRYAKEKANPPFGSADYEVAKSTLNQLLAQEPNKRRKPGMMVGKIQSGKTRSFLGVVGLAFDNGFDVAVIFTKNSLALADQTLIRIEGNLGQQNLVDVFDIMDMPASPDASEDRPKLVLLVKKEDQNVEALNDLFKREDLGLAARRVLIVDDEADITSVGQYLNNEGKIAFRKVHGLINEFRTITKDAFYLQVTATPYALFLQSEPGDDTAHSIRPAFSTLAKPGAGYIGTEYFFEQCDDPEHYSSLSVVNVSDSELEAVKKYDGRRINTENLLNAFPGSAKKPRKDNLAGIREALFGFVVASVSINMLREASGKTPQRYSFIVHTETRNKSQRWQDDLVNMMVAEIKDFVLKRPAVIKPRFEQSYDELKELAKRQGVILPPGAKVVERAMEAIRKNDLGTTVVNNDFEQRGAALFDKASGELRQNHKMSVFIGGQILDRGLTFSRLIGFYYGRNPEKSQQDTVLQHMRILGYRPKEEIAVTRVFCGASTRKALVKIHRMDSALWARLEALGGDVAAAGAAARTIFVSIDPDGKVVPCSPYKISTARTTTYAPGSRDLPVGFSTAPASVVEPIVSGIANKLAGLVGSDPVAPALVPLAKAVEILREIKPTLVFDGNSVSAKSKKSSKKRANKDGSFEWDHAIKALEKMSNESKDKSHAGQVWLMARGFGIAKKDDPRDIVRIKKDGSFSDAPDSAKTDTEDMRKKAKHAPGIILLKQLGARKRREEDGVDVGWSGTPFIWPVIVTPSEMTDPIIFAHEERK
jgi:hypothetical protein